jgi:hypothetical protein
MLSCVNEANCALCDTTWPVGLTLTFSTSKTSISGAPRPCVTEGPGWSEPGQEQELLTKIPMLSAENGDGDEVLMWDDDDDTISDEEPTRKTKALTRASAHSTSSAHNYIWLSTHWTEVLQLAPCPSTSDLGKVPTSHELYLSITQRSLGP